VELSKYNPFQVFKLVEAQRKNGERKNGGEARRTKPLSLPSFARHFSICTQLSESLKEAKVSATE